MRLRAAPVPCALVRGFWLSTMALAGGPGQARPGPGSPRGGPGASAVELGIAAGCASITVATPGAAFGATLPPEGRVQLLARLRGRPLQVRPFTALDSLAGDGAVLSNTMSGTTEAVPADTIVVVGERVASDWHALVP